ncbi:MAG: hypothetical protein RLZZ387_4356 [Chloroflexota bacterium]
MDSSDLRSPATTPLPPTSGDAAQKPGDRLRMLRHELRTPVNHIIGYSEMLLEEAEDSAPGDDAATSLLEDLRQIHASGRQLLLRINDALDPARLGDQQPDLAVIRVQIEAPLDHILAYSATLAARASATGRDDTALDAEKIAAAATRLRELVVGEQHAPPDERADEIPQPIGQGQAPHEPHQPRGTAQGRLLVVDDNAMNRDMLSRRLERLGYQVASAGGGRAALELLRRHPFDLALLDIMMPDMDGYQVLQALQADDELRHLPVIVLSALDEIESVVRCIEMGAQDYLPKPFDPVLLNARIDACLEKKRLHDQEVRFLQQITREKKRADDLLNVVIPIGVALSAEQHYHRLLEKIVVEAMKLCGCDGGTLYLRTDEDTLAFVIMRTASLGLALGGTTRAGIPLAPLPLADQATGAPATHHTVTQAAVTGRPVNVADTYSSDEFDFSGTHATDAATGYRSVSVLAVPLRDEIGCVIGVLQLINAQDPDTGAVVPFDPGMQQMIESLSALASAALAAYDREQRLRRQIDDLRIEVDEVRKRKQVSEITETEYFQSLQAQARRMREARQDRAAPPAAPAQPEGAEDAPAEKHAKTVYTIDGQDIHVYEEGNPRGQVAILVHGWSSSWFAMSPLLPQLSRYRCLAVDLPGYGDSPSLSERASIERYVELLAGLIRQVSPSRPVVYVGHSMGGMIGVMMALRHPELLERMALLCPTISGRLSTRINLLVSPVTMLERIDLASKIIARLEKRRVSVTDFMMRPVSFAERSGIGERDYRRIREDVRRPGQGKVRAECFWAMRNNNLSGKIGGIRVPTLVVWGMEDNTVPLRDASIIADEWPHAELRVIPKAGHWPQFEVPELTLRYLRGFLSTPTKLLNVQF